MIKCNIVTWKNCETENGPMEKLIKSKQNVEFVNISVLTLVY